MTIVAWCCNYLSMEIGKTSISYLLDLLFFALFLLLILALPIGFGVALGIAVTEWRMSGVRATHPLMVYFGVAVLAWLVPIGGIIPIPSGHSDAAMEGHFWRHQQQFGQLARILNGGMNESTSEQYLSILEQTGLSGAIERSEDGTIRFRYWEHRSKASGIWQEKGYAYSKKSLQPVVASLDQRPADVASGQCVYRKITDDWYMYYGWGDSFPFPYSCE